MLNARDVTVVRGLAAEVAEIAALPVQAEKRALWRRLNARQPARPMVLIDQILSAGTQNQPVMGT